MTNDSENLGRLLLLDSYDLDKASRAGDWTLLQNAIHHRCLGTTTVLLENGADPNHTNEPVPTPLELAERLGSPELIKVLKDYGAQGDCTGIYLLNRTFSM